MNNPIVEINNISMLFNLEEERTDTLKEYVLKKLSGGLKFDEFYALKDVSLSIGKGESVALIGANGSGKSTLLKVIAGVLYPTNGEIKVNGTVAPLIELGAGFDMDLTGRENIFLNGAILGYDRKFMQDHFEEIVDFAELRDFIDVPVKNYSSGMISRLGFAIATRVKADVLIVDEVLSVGDIKFQKKCEDRIEELLSNGSTLLFVSHNVEQVKNLCNRSILLDHGRIVIDGDTEKVVERYING